MDNKELEQEYINSYEYSSIQKLIAWFVALILLGALLIGGTYLTLGIINSLTK